MPKDRGTTCYWAQKPRCKKYILKDIKRGIEQIKLHKAGKIKLKRAQQLLDEL